VNYALEFSKTREYKECSELKEAINLVEGHLHKKYYLTSTISENIKLFLLTKSKKYLFCATGEVLIATLSSILFSNNRKNISGFFWLDKLGEGCQNIVYCNSKTNTVNYALGFSKNQYFFQITVKIFQDFEYSVTQNTI
jgi:hypothetical protein